MTLEQRFKHLILIKDKIAGTVWIRKKELKPIN